MEAKPYNIGISIPNCCQPLTGRSGIILCSSTMVLFGTVWILSELGITNINIWDFLPPAVCIGYGIAYFLHKDSKETVTSFSVDSERFFPISEPAKRQTRQNGGTALVLRSENGKEEIKLLPKHLLFIQSHDNYSNVVWRENGKIKEKLIRSSLSLLDRQIKAPTIVRSHRSYIVNLSRVRSVNGNSRGYRLFLENHPDVIPVSRKAGKKVLQSLEHIH